MEELSFLAEAIQLITSELSANLDSFADAILDASGVYRWSSTAQNELSELHWYVCIAAPVLRVELSVFHPGLHVLYVHSYLLQRLGVMNW